MKVTAYVYVRGEHGESALLVPGDRVPDWATVTNEAVLEADAKILPAPAPEKEPVKEDAKEPEKAPAKAPARKAAAPKE